MAEEGGVEPASVCGGASGRRRLPAGRLLRGERMGKGGDCALAGLRLAGWVGAGDGFFFEKPPLCFGHWHDRHDQPCQ